MPPNRAMALQLAPSTFLTNYNLQNSISPDHMAVGILGISAAIDKCIFI